MRQKPGPSEPAEEHMRAIRRATRKRGDRRGHRRHEDRDGDADATHRAGEEK